jgi:glycine/D-amino acid oxidase-like deaminating enzyme
MYDVSPDEDFILDYHPQDPRIVFATGLTGHGFKFGPLLGEMLTSLVRNTPPIVPMEHFRLARFAPARMSQAASVA